MPSNHCYRCDGHGTIQSLDHPWWQFWKVKTCPICDGDGYRKPTYQKPPPPPEPPPRESDTLPAYKLRIRHALAKAKQCPDCGESGMVAAACPCDYGKIVKEQYALFGQKNEWQLCPKCAGQGIVSRPPWVPGDLREWSSTSCAPHTCDVCNGTKILARPQGAA